MNYIVSNNLCFLTHLKKKTQFYNSKICSTFENNSSVPYHNNGDDNNSRQNSQKLKPRLIHVNLFVGKIPFRQQMIHWHVHEHPTRQAHRHCEYPISHPPLRRCVYHYSDRNTYWARDGECERIHDGGKQRTVRDHTEKSNSHGYRCENLVECYRP